MKRKLKSSWVALYSRAILVAACLALLLVSYARADGPPHLPLIKLVTEQSIRSEAEKKLIEEVMRRAGYRWSLEIMPLARALDYAERTDGVGIYSIARTPQREDRFKWAGEMMKSDYMLFKLRRRSDIQLRTVTDAFKYETATMVKSRDHLFLSSIGYPEERLFTVPGRREMMVRVLEGRSDLFAGSYLVLVELCMTFPSRCPEVDLALEIGPAPSWYLAFNKNTDTVVVQRVGEALAYLRNDGTYWGLMSEFLRY